MEGECFEDEEVAALMKHYFVCINVGREERPDLDAVYMDVSKYLGVRSGGPLMIIMPPKNRPYVGGTYFPYYEITRCGDC